MAIRYYVDPMVKNDKPTNEYDEIIFNSTDMSSTQNSVYTLNHQKVGTTHYLRGFPILKMTQNVDLFVGQFRATATFNENDKIIMIDSTDGTTEVIMVAEPIGADTQMPDEAFVNGDLVSITIDGVNKKLGFKIGGSGVNQTLPPQVTGFTATAGNAKVTISFNEIPSPYNENLKDYVLVYKKGGIPTGVNDGTKVVIPK